MCDLVTIVGTGIAELRCIEPIEEVLEVVVDMSLLTLVKNVGMSLMALRMGGLRE